MRFKLFIFIVLLVVILTFVYQNSTTVPVQFLTWEAAVPLALLLFGLLAAGVVLGAVMVLRRQAYTKKKKAAKAEQQTETAAADNPPATGLTGNDKVESDVEPVYGYDSAKNPGEKS